MNERFSPQPELSSNPKKESWKENFFNEVKKKLAEYVDSRQGFWKEQDFLALLNSKDISPPRKYQQKSSGKKTTRLHLEGEGLLRRIKREHLKERVQYEATTKPRLTSSEIIERDNLKATITRSFTKEQLSTDRRVKGNVDLALELDNGTEKRDIADYLPPGWKIVEIQNDNGTMQADLLRNQIMISRFIRIPVGQRGVVGTNEASLVRNDRDGDGEYEVHELMKTKGFILSLLHEAGHAFNSLGTSDEELQEQARLRGLGKSHPIFGQDTKVLSDLAFQQQYTEHVIQEERDAWYYALRVFRELKREDFTIENMNNREIMRYVEDSLSTYGNCFKVDNSQK